MTARPAFSQDTPPDFPFDRPEAMRGERSDSLDSIAADSLSAAMTDSLAAAGESLSAALADSLSMASDSLRGAAGPRPSKQIPAWRRPRNPWVPLVPSGRVFSGDQADLSVEPVLRDLLEWELGQRVIPSGSYHLPDQVGEGDLPGREPPSPIVDGLPQGLPGYPEMPPDGVGLLWLERAVLRPADPLTLPSNPTAGPILELELIRPDSTLPISGARLTSGSNETFTEEIFLARPAGDLLFRLFYQDHKTAGRYGYYLDQGGENLQARVDGGWSQGGWRLGWRHQFSRIRLIDERRHLWDRSGIDGGLDGAWGRWEADLTVGLTWERHDWESAAPLRRKDALGRGLLRLRGPGSALRPLATVQIDGQRLRAYQPNVLSLDEKSVGLGLAAGVEGLSAGWRYRASLGRSEPAMDRSDWVAALDAARDLGRFLSFSIHAGRSVRAPLMPRLADDLEVAVGQGLTVPVVDPDRRLEVLHKGSARLERALGRGNLFLEGRVLEIRHTVSGEDGALLYFRPEGYALLPPEALDRTIRSAAVQAGGRTRLGWGFSFHGDAAVRWSDPSWESQFWMTPWDARTRLDWQRRFFKGDLWIDLFLRGSLSGRRATPVLDTASPTALDTVILPGGDRYDGGGAARIGSLTFFFMLLNLEDDVREAAAYEGGWIVKPFRSYRMGLTWRFPD